LKIKKILILILIFMIAFAEISIAAPISNIYKQGIYPISDKNAFSATASIVTPNNVTSLMITDSNGKLKFYKIFDTVNQEVNLGNIKYGDVAVIVGSGELAIIIYT